MTVLVKAPSLPSPGGLGDRILSLRGRVRGKTVTNYGNINNIEQTTIKQTFITETIVDSILRLPSIVKSFVDRLSFFSNSAKVRP